MLSYAIIGLAILVGYMVTVGTALVATIGIASGAPNFTVSGYRVRNSYKVLHESIWFVCAMLGGFVASMADMGVYVWKAELGLSAALLIMLWRNTWEARQRGTAHQILISLLTVAGVLAGYALERRL